jgi:hypothetical protein
MAGVDLTEMDIAILRQLHKLGPGQSLNPAELQSRLRDSFRGWDETSMREGISLTRLRGRGLIEESLDGTVAITTEGAALAAGLTDE